VSARLRAVARETLEIVERGSYRVGGRIELIAGQVERAVSRTRLYGPDEVLPGLPTRGGSMRVEVTGEDSLTACARVGAGVACLVFASARNPGGGFLTGAQAQEEAVARSSALYPCLRAVPEFYAHHRAHREGTYSDRVIYAPDVPVIRTAAGELAPAREVSFLVAAAPNRTSVRQHQPERLADIPEILCRRATRVLDVAAQHGHAELVLGAWGCGVFGNDPTTVATAFATALQRNRSFDRVVFAVLDTQRDRPTYRAFEAVLAPV
jgi:uncharacterized protein (TIGR02452 family)